MKTRIIFIILLLMARVNTSFIYTFEHSTGRVSHLKKRIKCEVVQKVLNKYLYYGITHKKNR